jgi:hypothetical protein
MKNKYRYMPTNYGEFDRFYKAITQYVAQKTAGSDPEWKHILKEARDSLIAEYAVWYTAYALTFKPHTRVETLGKQNAYKTAAKHLRGFINQYLKFPPVTDQDRLALGIPSPDLIRTTRKPPDEKVEFTFKLKDVRQLEVRFKVRDAIGRAKPHGYHGAVIAWDLLDKPPARHAELTRHVTATRTPYTLEFDDADRGKTVYVALCWQNGKGQNGSWTVMQPAIVP